ncbi:MAG: hypothetical protein ACR2LR_01200 [Hassallia sp.]
MISAMGSYFILHPSIGREALSERILQQPPEIGYLTISNALQWRSQYSRIIQVAITTTTAGV